jgi:hypothetical protein
MRTLLTLVLFALVRAKESCFLSFDCKCDNVLTLDCHCPDTHKSTWYGGCRRADQDDTFVPLPMCSFDAHCETTSFLGGHCKAGHEVDTDVFFRSCKPDTSSQPLAA